MADAALDAFLARMKTDDLFRRRVEQAISVEERLALIRAEGYDVTAEALAALVAMRLSDEDLGQVSAGGGCPDYCIPLPCSGDDCPFD